MSRITWQVVTLVLVLALQLEVFILLWAIYVMRPNWLLEQEMKHHLLPPKPDAREADTLVFPPPPKVTEADPA